MADFDEKFKKANSRFQLGSNFINPNDPSLTVDSDEYLAYNDTISTLANPQAAGGGQQVQFYHMATDQRAEFAAFITSFSDSYSSNWDSVEAIGRMDPIMNFRNTVRTINLGLDVPSASRREAAVNMAEVSRLIQFLYPTYTVNGSATIMNGSPLVKVQFQNIIASGRDITVGSKAPPIAINAKKRGLIAAINSLSATPDFEVGTFGSKTDPGFNSTFGLEELNPMDHTMQYPKLWRVELSMTILHDHSMDARFQKNAAFPYYNSSQEYYDVAAATAKAEAQALDEEISEVQEEFNEHVAEIMLSEKVSHSKATAFAKMSYKGSAWERLQKLKEQRNQ